MRHPSTATVVSIPAVAALVALVMVYTSYRATRPEVPAPAVVLESAVPPAPGPEQATLEPQITARECEGDGDAICVVTFRVVMDWAGPRCRPARPGRCPIASPACWTPGWRGGS